MVSQLPKETPTYNALSRIEKAAINRRLEKIWENILSDNKDSNDKDIPNMQNWHAFQKESLAKQAKQNPEILETFIKEYRNEQQKSKITPQVRRGLERISDNAKNYRNR